MPAWIHDRARHLQRKNPEMPEGQAFAIEKIAVIAPPSHERIVGALTEIEEKKVNV